jgi:sigma-E factor negative regulatory protein RseA
MEKNQKNQQQISELMDGELDPEHLPSVMSSAYQASGRECWDIYHHIGDVLRSEEMAYVPTKNFNQRLAIQLANEPSFIAPTKRRGILMLSKWPATAAAAAAVLTGFVIAPTLVHWPAETHDSASLLIPKPADEVAVTDRQSSNADSRELQHYILWHQSSTPSLYGLRAIAHPASPSRQ